MMASKKPTDWKLCADWLVRCGVLPADHSATQLISQPHDLLYTLRDGVILCELLNKLYPGSVDEKEYSQHPQISLFLHKKNARAFLRACKTVFQLKDADLFEYFDLLEVNNFWKVIRTLSKLSQCQEVRKMRIAPFNVGEKPADEYLNTNSFAFNDEFNDDNPYAVPSYQKGEGDVYGRLMDYVQPASPSCNSPNLKPKSHVNLCISELMESEGKYLEVLKMIKDKFMPQLKSVIAPADHNVIFKNIERLHANHTEFYQNLRDVYSGKSNYNIADCFIMSKEKFLVYGDYCSNLLTAQNLLNKLCQTSPAVQAFVQECQQAANDSQFKLWELLTVPMQRVLKYHLFLKELLKNTDAADTMKKGLQRALEEIEDLSLFVNEVARDNEMLHTISQVAESIPDLHLDNGVLLKDYGRMLTDGEMKVKCDGSTKQSNRYVFLLDKLLLICKPEGDSHKLKSFVLLANYELDDTPSTGKTNPYFSLRERPPGKGVFVFAAKSTELRNKWINAINMAKDNISPRFANAAGHKFVMASFDVPTVCDVCRKLLRGVFFQGYKCRKSHLNVHKECIEKAKNIREAPTTLQPRGIARCSSMVSPSIERTLQHSAASDPLLRENPGDGRWRHANAQTIVEPMGQRRVSVAAEERIYSNDNCVNELCRYPWYAGDMSRLEAEEKLRTKPNGTFLIRLSPAKREDVLSIKCDSILHTVINKSSSGQYYFKKSELYASIFDLVTHYGSHSLNDVFKEVDTNLKTPYSLARTVETEIQPGVLGYCYAIYDYAARSPNQLTLKKDDKIAIISKSGEARGWWKGRIGTQVGYFPYAYVREEELR